jgi:hypothetical protein
MNIGCGFTLKVLQVEFVRVGVDVREREGQK